MLCDTIECPSILSSATNDDAPEVLDWTNSTIILTTGYSRTSPETKFPSGGPSVAYNQAKYIRSKIKTAGVNILVRPTSWGTKQEIEHAFQLARAECKVNNADEEEAAVIFVSNPLHLYIRTDIWALTFISLGKWNGKIILLPANHSLSKKEQLEEFVLHIPASMIEASVMLIRAHALSFFSKIISFPRQLIGAFGSPFAE
jgi:hypothetical protein